jgi:NO-binding membrane sensor protein with MHYT domain
MRFPDSVSVYTSARGAASGAAARAGNGAGTVTARGLTGVASVASVHNFSYGLLNPGLAFAMSCLGGFLGLRCVILARAYEGAARARWLVLASVSIGAVGIWSMHFIAMLGFTIPGEPIRYNVTLTIASMLLAVAVVGAGLFIVGFGNGELHRLLMGGVIIGVGVAAMHYVGMAAMSMPGSMSYRLPLVALSVLIAIVAGTAVLWIGTWVRSVAATVGAAIVVGIAVTGMHYTGMAALRVTGGLMPSRGGDGMPAVSGVSGATAATFLIPLLVISLATFLLTLSISMTPGEDEIRADAEMRRRLRYLEQRGTPDRGA